MSNLVFSMDTPRRKFRRAPTRRGDRMNRLDTIQVLPAADLLSEARFAMAYSCRSAEAHGNYFPRHTNINSFIGKLRRRFVLAGLAPRAAGARAGRPDRRRSSGGTGKGGQLLKWKVPQR